MNEPLVGRIIIEDLHARAILGINDDERRERQDLLVNIELWCGIGAAAGTDRFEDAVDYRALKKDVLRFVEHSSFFLVETLAARILDLCTKDPRVLRARVRVDKPGALRFARSVGVEVERARP